MADPRPESFSEVRSDKARASATPHRGPKRNTSEVSSNQQGEGLKPVDASLETLESWFAAVVTHPESAEEGLLAQGQQQQQMGAQHLNQILKDGPQQSAAERLEIYQYAYFARLAECLEDDFPGVFHALGEEEFEKLSQEYVLAYPSGTRNLMHFGQNFAEFCARRKDSSTAPFLADLARLEWQMVEVVHAPPGEALPMERLAQLAPEQWAGIRLPKSPTLRFATYSYPVHAYMMALDHDEEPGIPEPLWSAVAVYRKGFQLWRMPLTRPMTAVLSALLDGQTLGEALSRLENEENAGEDDVMVWFKEWVEGGFFAGVEIPRTSE